MIRIALFVMLSLLPIAGQAGPWPREVGQTFLALTTERDRDDTRYHSLYAEYGLAPRTTLGVELGQADPGDASAMIWVQRALDDGQGSLRLAMQGGIGMTRRDGLTLGVLQSAVSVGRGFDSRWGGGWLQAQLLARMTVAQPEGRTQAPSFVAGFLTAGRVVKADLTVGLRPREGMMVVNSLWLEDRDDAVFSARLASSVAFQLRGPVQVELGMVQPLTGDALPAVRLGTWIAF